MQILFCRYFWSRRRTSATIINHTLELEDWNMPANICESEELCFTSNTKHRYLGTKGARSFMTASTRGIFLRIFVIVIIEVTMGYQNITPLRLPSHPRSIAWARRKHNHLSDGSFPFPFLMEYMAVELH